MNRIIFTAFILLFSYSLFGQTVDPITKPQKPFQIQAGINVTGFIRQFVNFSGNNLSTATTPYTINLKIFRKFPKQEALIGGRFGMGYVNNNIVTESTITTTNNLNETFDYRVGLEYQKTITKKWIGYVGIDYISQKISNKITTRYLDAGVPTDNYSLMDRTTIMDGGGLVFGLQFYITKRIALATEASYYYSDTWYRNNVFSTTSTTNQPPTVTKTTNTSLLLPNVIYFTILF